VPVGRPLGVGKPATAAGQRWQRVTIERFTPASTSSGFPGGTWAALATVWMSKKDVRADERFMAGQESAYFETTWFSEYRSDIDPELVDVTATLRLNFRDRIFDIRAASQVGRQQGIEFTTLGQGRVEAA
jgi:SPP1 family predicted phage head-tail adaptor